MSKKKRTALIILALVLVILIAVMWINYDLLMVVKDGLLETTETIDMKKEEVSNKEKEVLKDAGVSNIRPLTEDEKNEFNKGNITEDDAVKIITGQTTMEEIKEEKPSQNEEVNPSQSGNTTAPSENQPANGSEADNLLNDKIAELIGKIYVLEAKFTSELGALEKWAVDEYNATPKSEKAAKKKELASYGWPKLVALEKECDTNVKIVLDELRTILKDAGQNTDLADQINSAYKDKKQLAKSRYISEYM